VNIPYYISESLETIFWVKNTDPQHGQKHGNSWHSDIGLCGIKEPLDKSGILL
jgi:hypothetical protein